MTKHWLNASARVTIIMLQRDRFSLAKRALDALFTNTNVPFDLIYVDAGSPSEIRAMLEREADRRGFELLRSEAFLSPNQARNLALRRVRTEYVLFLDNDCLVGSDWLAPLIDCADETRAGIVGPLYCEDGPLGHRIHMAGGEARFVEENGSRHFHEMHYHLGLPLSSVGRHLCRRHTEMVEFHAMLLSMNTCESLGALDEHYLSSRDAIDLCLKVRNHGRDVFIEPASCVTFLRPPPIAPLDRNYYWLRWSDAWNRASLDYFRDHWQLGDDDPSYEDHLRWLTNQRQLILDPLRRLVSLLGNQLGYVLDRLVLRPAEHRLNRRAFSAPVVTDRRQRNAAGGTKTKVTGMASPTPVCCEL